ncbi:MAG: alpha-amylase family glycosyl hydrolase [Candidatus Woesearchaeota archaeon]|jgi:hypothetical protein
MVKKEIDYAWEKQVYDPLPEKDINSWQTKTGTIILTRNPDGTAKLVKFQLLVDNPYQEIFLLCNGSNWQKNDSFKFVSDQYSVYYTLETDKIKHNEEFLLLINNIQRKDPACYFFAKNGNCLFYDFDDPKCYKMKYEKQNPIEKSLKILQTDVLGFIYHWKSKHEEKYGKNVPRDTTFKFMVESGILEFVKELGFNAIQFLPIAQSIDGDNWKFRYLVVYHYATNNIYGTPDDFAKFVDECHRLGISVIDDVVLGHMPDRDYSVFGKIGDLHLWYNRFGFQSFMDEETLWGTRRPNFKNPYLRRYLVDSCIHFMKHFRIDGFRIDNVDGILRFGPAGDGDDRPGGRDFLRELARELYTYNRYCLISYEAHFFYEDNARMLVAPLDNFGRALGGTAYNESRVTYYLHKDYMLKTAKEITIWRFKHISEEKEWGKSNSCIADFHNHDAAAGLMHGRATGAYAYVCMTLKNPSLHKFAAGKIKIMDALICFYMEGRNLDLMQSFLLQQGTFEHDTGITWGAVFENNDVKRMQNFKKDINKVMDERAFWPINNHTRKYINVDDNCKVLAITRYDDSVSNDNSDGNKSGDKYIVVTNLSDYEHSAYCLGVEDEGEYVCVFNSDELKYGGTCTTRYYSPLKTRPTNKFEFFSKELDLGTIAPYEVLVLKLKK